jgi:transposase
MIARRWGRAGVHQGDVVETKRKPVRPAKGEQRVTRRRHSLAFKRGLVEQTLVPGASVARIALEHGVNANLLFKWRRQHVRASRSAPPSLLPVILSEARARSDLPVATPAARPAAGGGAIDVQLPAGRIRINLETAVGRRFKAQDGGA